MRKELGLLSILSTMALGMAGCSDTSGLTQRHDAGADTKAVGGSTGKGGSTGTGGTAGSIGGSGGGMIGGGGSVGGARAGGSSGAGGVSAGGAKSSGGSTGGGGPINRDGGGFTLPDLGFGRPDGGLTLPDLGFRLPDGGFTLPDLGRFNLDAFPGMLGDAGIGIKTCESSAVAGADCKAGTDAVCSAQSGSFCLCFGSTWTCL